MSLLFRYLTKNNAMILLPTLAVGIGLYVLRTCSSVLTTSSRPGCPWAWCSPTSS